MAKGYEYRINGGSAVDGGDNKTIVVPGLTASTSYNFETRKRDALGNFSAWSAVAAGTTAAGSGTGNVTWQDTSNVLTTAPNLSRNAGGNGRASSVELISPTAGHDVYFEYTGASGEANFGGESTTVFLVADADNGVNYPRTPFPNTNLTGQAIAMRGLFGSSYNAAGVYIAGSPADSSISVGDKIRIGFDGSGHARFQWWQGASWNVYYTSAATFSGNYRIYVEFANDGGTNQITSVSYQQ
jgi:chitodextrinase